MIKLKLSKSKILANVRLKKNIFLLQVSVGIPDYDFIPGQFFNIKVSDGNYPFLRRPFSICDYTNGILTFMIDVNGEGTHLLSLKKSGEELDLLGPLGNGFEIEGNYEDAIFIGGGIGVAPFPYLTRKMGKSKNIISFIGGRSSEDLISYNLDNVNQATDDGSIGYKGNVVECFIDYEKRSSLTNYRIFACGPTPMLKSIREFAIKNNVECQISTESSMACGFGLCQGCAIEKSDSSGYSLICKDGPVYNSKEVLL